MTIEFVAFPKMGRLRRGVTVTEKIDGTNAAVVISDDGTEIGFQSRNRIIAPGDDNMGFAAWGSAHRDELMKLGPGHHYGAWWGAGIQRRYGLTAGDKRFYLFNVERWRDGRADRPACCGVVPILYEGLWDDSAIEAAIQDLRANGSRAAPGFKEPEGVVIFHKAVRTYFKVLLENDEMSKGEAEAMKEAA